MFLAVKAPLFVLRTYLLCLDAFQLCRVHNVPYYRKEEKRADCGLALFVGPHQSRAALYSGVNSTVSAELDTI